MTDFKLHIICFDIPFPADYGGAIEEFYKLKALHQIGVKIHLHCFEYGDRKPQASLENYCEKIYYYKRERRMQDVFSTIPFIVKSRMHEELLQNLLKNDFPILFDGTHTTGFLNHVQLKSRKKIVRLHNIEWIYYRVLFDSAVSFKEKLFYFSEYKKLREYDKQLENADVLSCLSQTDYEYYREKFPSKKISLEFVFHENESVQSKTGKGDYILYHGNLSLMDNYQIIIDLLANELKDCGYPIVIAGKNPDKALQDFARDKKQVKLLANPTNEALNVLIQNAHICLAIAKNPSGVKLKLINSLFKARFVVSDWNASHGSDLDRLCFIPQHRNEVLQGIESLMQQEFREHEIALRKSVFYKKYNNLENAQQLLNHIFVS